MRRSQTAADRASHRAGSWRRRLVRTLLYGRNVDRAAKARARIGLAISSSPSVTAIIATQARPVRGRARQPRRRGAPCGPDAVATARPDILDRNGEILATDVRTPSLFARAAPHHRCRRGVRAPHRGDARPRCRGTARAARFASAASCGSSARSRPSSASEIHRLGLPGVGFLPENKRVYPNGAEVSHIIGHVNIDNQGIAGIEKWLDTRGLADLHLAGLATDRLQKPIELAVDLRVQHAMRDELDRGARSSSRRWRQRGC